MATEQDFLTSLGRIDAATDNIAADLRALADQIAGGGLSSTIEGSVLAKLNDAATKLEAVAATTPDGEPTPEPTPDEGTITT